jgi:hypothetical protein
MRSDHGGKAMNEQLTEWIEKSGTWSRIVPGAAGRPNVSLGVESDPGDAEEPWAWAVMERDPDDAYAEYDIGLGGALTLEAAKAAAEERAAAYRRGEKLERDS